MITPGDYLFSPLAGQTVIVVRDELSPLFKVPLLLLRDTSGKQEGFLLIKGKVVALIKARKVWWIKDPCHAVR